MQVSNLQEIRLNKQHKQSLRLTGSGFLLGTEGDLHIVERNEPRGGSHATAHTHDSIATHTTRP